MLTSAEQAPARRPTSKRLFQNSFDDAPDHSVRELWFVIVGALILFAIDYALVVRGAAKPWDDRVILWIHARSTPWLDHLMRWITRTGGVWRTLPVIAVTGFLVSTRRRLEAGVFLASVLVAQAATFGLKALVQRDRPGLFDVANQPTDTSFPSGHALGSSVLGGMVAVWLWQRGHRLAAGSVLLWVGAVSFSRVYLGAHHPTDVLASLCLGVAFTGSAGLVYHHLHHRVAGRRNMTTQGAGPTETVISDVRLWMFAAAGFVSFAADYLLIKAGWIGGWEDNLIVWIHGHSSTTSVRVMTWISVSGGFWRIVPIVLAAGFLLLTRRWIDAATFVGSAVLAQGSRFMLTAFFPRPRPVLFVGDETGDTSFPSGHAYGSTVVYGMIAYWLWRRGHRKLAVVVACWPLLVGFSRISLGAHHPSDVVASIALGIGWLALTVLAHKHLCRRWPAQMVRAPASVLRRDERVLIPADSNAARVTTIARRIPCQRAID